jgi:hypothetical protein
VDSQGLFAGLMGMFPPAETVVQNVIVRQIDMRRQVRLRNCLLNAVSGKGESF